MKKQKRIDWLEFTFNPTAMTVPEGYRLEIVGEQYMNYDMHSRYEVVNESPAFQPVQYTVFQSQKRGTYFVQWTGSTIPYDPLSTLRSLAGFFGLLDEEITIKRIDIAFDLACEMPLINRNHARTRCKVYGRFDSNGTTHYFGKSPLFLRIYDKKAELEAGRPDRYDSYFNLTNFDQEAVTRVEYQVRAEALMKRGISHAGQLFALLPQLEAYLVREWFWIPRTRNKNDNTYSPFWSEVVDLVDEYYNLSPIEKASADCEKLRRSAFSVLASAYIGSLDKGQEPSPEAYREYVGHYLMEFVPSQGWAGLWEEKQ